MIYSEWAKPISKSILKYFLFYSLVQETVEKTRVSLIPDFIPEEGEPKRYANKSNYIYAFNNPSNACLHYSVNFFC